PPTTTVASFTVANPAAVPGDFSAEIDWGDGSPTSFGTIVAGPVLPAGPTFLVQGGHTYAEEGTYTIKGHFSDNFGQTVTSTATANVADAVLTAPTGVALKAVEGQTLSNVAVATFTDTNPLGTTSDFTAIITWGDGSTSSGVVTLVGGGP